MFGDRLLRGIQLISVGSWHAVAGKSAAETQRRTWGSGAGGGASCKIKLDKVQNVSAMIGSTQNETTASGNTLFAHFPACRLEGALLISERKTKQKQKNTAVIRSLTVSVEINGLF